MNRTRTLLIIGVFMLSLAVLAALEFRVQDEPPSEGQMVTGSLSKDMPALPKLPSLGDSEGNKGGVLVSLDNGTLRGSAAPLDMSAIPPDEETPAGKDTPETAAPAADPAVSAEKPAPAPMGEIAPADTFTEKPKQPVAEEKAPQQEKKAEKAVAEKPAEKPQPKVSEPKQEKEQAALMKLADRMDELQLCCDRMATRIQQEENRQRLLTDGCILAFEGWVPASGEKKLESLLAEFDCAYELREPTPEEYPEVPVKLNSNWLTRSMNCITEQYSLPAYDGVDPNPIMAPFFIFFFGMMMADMAYGLIMMIGTQVYLRKNRPADRSFMEMFFWCGISTFIFGALTGGFLGDFIPQLCKMINPASTFELPALFSPLNDTMAIMVGSLILGGIQIITGMTVSVVKKCKDGCFQDALWDEITWWVILLGGALAVLKAGSVAGVPVVLVVGIVMLVIGSGRGKKGFGKVTGFVSAVYDGVTGFFSDILSYVRLMALMLSGAVLAQVFNMLGATTGNIVTFVLISLIGNVLNLALNLLGCYVHDMRLQFLEFFGRFYKEGGKAYKPLSVQSKYVEILKEEK